MTIMSLYICNKVSFSVSKVNSGASMLYVSKEEAGKSIVTKSSAATAKFLLAPVAKTRGNGLITPVRIMFVDEKKMSCGKGRAYLFPFLRTHLTGGRHPPGLYLRARNARVCHFRRQHPHNKKLVTCTTLVANSIDN
ncbi:hypothetical protein FOB63_004849 [Clavispora lusitaniae]|uniref:uncharacterized protein n=1 Tax=Clavispora lusitaniae TaxID=36911 RepID=UPI00202BC010|nr:hypothetical protein FOB63_004849 [Clavispora lusitaniae]